MRLLLWEDSGMFAKKPCVRLCSDEFRWADGSNEEAHLPIAILIDESNTSGKITLATIGNVDIWRSIVGRHCVVLRLRWRATNAVFFPVKQI